MRDERRLLFHEGRLLCSCLRFCPLDYNDEGDDEAAYEEVKGGGIAAGGGYGRVCCAMFNTQKAARLASVTQFSYRPCS